MKPVLGTRGRIYKHNPNGALLVAHFLPERDAYGPWDYPTPADRRDYLKAKKKRVGRVRRASSRALLTLDPFR